MRTLILGLGNPILRDDAVGLHVVRALRPRLQDRADIDVEEDYHGGLRLMERMIGYDRAIIVDAIQTGAEPGTIHPVGSRDLPTQHSASPHDVALPTALEVGRRAGARLPSDEHIHILGIEAHEVSTFGSELTPRVAAALEPAVKAVLALLSKKQGTPDDLSGDP